MVDKISIANIQNNSCSAAPPPEVKGLKVSAFQGYFKPAKTEMNEDGSGTKVTRKVDKNGNITETTEKFGTGGKLLEKQVKTTTPKGKIIAFDNLKNTYDKDGNLTSNKRTTVKGKTKTVVENTIGKNNKISQQKKQVTTQKGNKKLTSSITSNYEYDGNNNLIRKISKGKDEVGKPTLCEVEYANNKPIKSHSRFYSKGALNETYTDFRKSAAGLPETRIIYDKDGKTVCEKTENQFDADGILSYQSITDAQGKKTTYDYSKVDGKFDISNQQGRGDCYLLASINALRETPAGEKLLEQTVKNNGDGTYTITFPGAKIARESLIKGEGNGKIVCKDGSKNNLPADKVYIQESYTITEEELKAALKQQGKKYSVGDRDVVLMEVAFEKYRQDVDKTVRENNIDTNKTRFIAGVDIASKRVGTDDVLSSGKPADAMFILTGYQSENQYITDATKKPTCYINSDMNMVVADENGNISTLESSKAMSSVQTGGFTNKIDNLITKVQKDSADGKLDDYAVTAAFNVSGQEINGEVIPGGGHALTVTKITNDTVYLRNPWDPAKEITMSINDFKKSATSMNIMPLKALQPQQQNSSQTTTQNTVQPQQPQQPQQNQQPVNNKPNYTVKQGQGYTAIIKKALQDQGIEPTKENIQKAKIQFEKANPGAVHTYNGKRKEWHGNKYLYADAQVFIPQFKI